MTGSAVPPLGPDSALERGHFWERTVLGWHLAFAGLLVVAAGAGLVDETASWPARAAAIGLLALWGVWYGVAGRRLWDEPSPRRQIYVAGMIALCLGAAAAVPATSLSLFAAIPQIYACIRRMRWAVLSVLVLFGGFFLVLAARGAAADVLVQLGFSALFSLVIGSWIGGIIAQSRQRAELITQLRQTREELSAAQRRHGALAERERLSRDIHDTIAQGFTSIVMLLEATEAEIGTDDDAARRYLELARATARENLAETRSLVAALSPVGLTDASLVDAVRRLVERCGEQSRLVTEFTVRGEPRRLPAPTEVVLLRAAQEGLANVGKHAGAERVGVHLDYDGGRTLLRVTDDGAGFEPGSAAGFGLNGMRARAEEVGGSVCVDSRPGAGTILEVWV